MDVAVGRKLDGVGVGMPKFAARLMVAAFIIFVLWAVGWWYFVFQSYERYTLKRFIMTLEQPASVPGWQNDDISAQMKSFFMKRGVDINDHETMKIYFQNSKIFFFWR